MDRTGLLFGEVAAVYERVRPTYPAELFDDVAALTGAPPPAEVPQSSVSRPAGTAGSWNRLSYAGWRLAVAALPFGCWVWG